MRGQPGVVRHFVRDDGGLVIRALPVARDAEVCGAGGVADGRGPGIGEVEQA